ncbi:hypothetical protein ASG76_13205 [Nocardioides sp. Soil774]|nr:hypothetical protein ASG76_13205 [Nocardioides sp. Soil774]
MLSRAVPALLSSVVASIVLGIIGMHALSTHGVMGSTDHSAMTSPMTGAHDEMSGLLTSPASEANAGIVSIAPDSGDGHDMGTMVMLCLAMLAAAAALLLVLVGLRRRPRVWAHRHAITTTVTRWATRHGTGPPYVWNFSVIRC